MDDSSEASVGCTERAAEGKPELLVDGAKTVPEGTTSSSEETCTEDREDKDVPVQEIIEDSKSQEAVKDGLTKESKDSPLSDKASCGLPADGAKTVPEETCTKDKASSGLAVEGSETSLDIPKTVGYCQQPGQEVNSTEERGTDAKLHPLGDTEEGIENSSQAPKDQKSCQSTDNQQSLKDQAQTEAEVGLPNEPSEESVTTLEGMNQTSSEEITTKVTAASSKNESSDTNQMNPSMQCTRDQSDSPLDALELPKSDLSSIRSSSQSAKTCPTPEVTSQGQCSKQELTLSVPTSSNLSLPSLETMQNDSECSQKVEDTVNNNVQKCTTSCQEPKEVAVSEAVAPPQKPSNTDQSDCAMMNAKKETDKPSPSVNETVEPAGESIQNRSMLMKYLGLQPVQEGGKSSKDPGGDVLSARQRLSVSYMDSFSLMPGLDPINSYEKGQISYNTSPFEVCSTGSHSPEPPLLAETPVVGSSPPHHDYDAMEARMMDMTPRMNSAMGKGDLLNSFPQSHPPGQDAKTAFNRKQHGVLGYASSHTLDSLCHRLAERVEPDVPSQDPTLSQGTKLSEAFYSIPSKNQEDHDKNGAKAKNFSSVSEVVPCPRCHRTFKNRNQLRGHLRWHINDPINLLSGRWPKDRSNTHENGLATGKSSGNILDKSGKKKKISKVRLDAERQTPLSHISGVTQDGFPCTLCTKVFRTSLKLRGHMMVHKRKQSKKKTLYWRNKTSKSPGSHGRGGKFQCDICSEKYESQLKLSAHKSTHAKEFHLRSKGVRRLGSLATSNGEGSSLDSGLSGITDIRQKAVMEKRKGPFKCDICFKTFPTLRARNGHKGIHSSKWKLANSLHHPGNPGRIKKEASEQTPPLEGLSSSETFTRQSDQTDSTKRDENVDPNEADGSTTENQSALKPRVRNLYFQCIHCHLVFASRHRVRKHLFKVHSIMPPASDSFTEEKVDGCKFCEVFKKRKRGRPKRGENTLVQCPHGKVVVGYNLPLNSLRLSRKIRGTPKTVKTEEKDALTPGDIVPQKCSVKLSPKDVNAARERRDIQDNSEDSKVPDFLSVKKRGRPPKDRLKPAHNLQNARKIVFSVGGNKSCRGRTRAFSAIRRRRMGKEISLLGRQLKSGWDPKRQRFIGRPYKCHLCKMSYRSERQLCSHMRSHGIHIFDLSQLPADQRGNAFMSSEDMDTKSDDGQDLDTPESNMSTKLSEGFTATPPTEPDLESTPGENGVGGTCGVCKKEFDSDNMFHQHLLGRYNKKCRQEWMKHTFGFGNGNKVQDAPEQDVVDEQDPVDSKDEQNNGNLYVIDKINMETCQGSGIFSNLQQKVNDKIENVLQREKRANSCSRSLENAERLETEKSPPISTQSDAGLANSVSPKKGSVLNAVINRLTQSSKPSDDIPSNTPSDSSESSKPGKRSRKGSDKLMFTCNICNKIFDKKQKLSVHAMIHRRKVVTVMDHVEIATQRSGSGISTLPTGGDQQQSLQNQVVNDSLGNTVQEPVAPMHLLYTCTECPKQFTSNLKLATHLKMHLKSTMSRSPKHDTSLACKPQDLKAEQTPVTNTPDFPANPTEPTNYSTKLPKKEMSPPSESELPAIKEVRSDGNACDLTVPTSSDDISKPVDTVKDVPIEQDVNQDGENIHTESEKISTGRPRLLLKINPATLQRFYNCQECSKSFKSRRHLAQHQRIHAEEKSSCAQSDSSTTLSSENEHCQPDHSEFVPHSYESEEKTASTELCLQDSDQSSVGNDNHEPSHNTVNVENTSVHAKQSNEVRPPEKNVPCKICDKVMKKSQLGGHMKSHTKELLSRKFTGSGNGSAIDKRQFRDSAMGKRFREREIISGVDLYRSVSRNADSTLGNSLTGAVHGIAAVDMVETAGDTEFGASMTVMNNYGEELEDKDVGKQQFTCSVCNLKYDSYQQLCQHLKIHVVKKPSFSESMATPDISGAPPSDDNVDKEASFMESAEHTFARPKVYPCELCGFSFSSFRQFRVHISQTHGGKYQYRLMLQQKEAAKAGAFLKEPDTINKTHPHKCDVCGRRFKRLALLIFHLNKLHKGWKQRLCMMNVRSRPRPPHTAVQKTPGTNGQTVPGATGVDPADLPFTCELCGKSFRMKVQLCGHMKTHGRVGHSPIKITPLAMKGKYTLRKSRKPDFRLSDEWILDMDDERMAFENSMALQQLPPRQGMVEQSNKMKGPPDASMYNAPMYGAKPGASTMFGSKKIIPGLAEHTDQYRMPMSSPEMPMTAPALDLKIPGAPLPPEPSKFITIQMEPVLQQMLHRCLLCHSYFSSQESAVLHCKEVHFKKKPRTSFVDAGQTPAHPLGHNYQMSHAAPEVRPHSAQHPPVVCPVRPQVSPSLGPPVPQHMHCPPPMASQITTRVRSPTPQPVPNIKPPGFDRVNVPPTRFPASTGQPPGLPYTGPRTKVAPTSTPTAKTISQTPFNEMLYRAEMLEGQTRYVCNTCKSTFLHYNFLMSHLAEHNHLAYTCLQCGYATYSEKDYQLHCQLHDGQISKKIRRVRPKPPGYSSNSNDKGAAPRAVATCHICQRSFVNMKGLKAHMVLHSANYNSISERRNESRKIPRSILVPVTCFSEVAPEPLSLVKPTGEQTEALDLTVKPVVDTSVDEVLDLSMGSRSFTDRAESPDVESSLDMTVKSDPEESQAVSLPDVCQVVQQLDVPEEPTSSPIPPISGKLTHVRKPKNSIRLVGAIDVDVASLENKYSVVTDLMDTDSDISPDVPTSGGQESPARSGEGEGGKSPKKARNYKCSMCQYATDFKDSMERHEMKHRKFRTLACHACSYRTPEKRLMLRHVLTIHEKQKPYKCKLCNYSSAYKHHLKRHHTKRHQRPLLTCNLCEFTTDEASKLKSHSASHPEPKVYQCKLCPMVFNSSKLFKAHKQIVHHKKKKSKKSSRDKSHSSSSVVESSESMTEGKEIESLASSEEPSEPVVLKHPCNLCKYQTDDQNELTIHLRKIHFSSQIKEVLGDVCSTAQCPQCGYLTGKEQMKVHMKIHDSGELFNCDQCLFKACSQGEVDEHVQQKHKVKLAPTQMCKMCNMRFWNAEDLKQHTEMHLKDTTISVKNPFLCNMCPLKLMNRRDALRHLQLHTDRYPFKCRHCVFSCFTKASIQRHLSIHRHAGKPKSLTAIRKNGRKSHSVGASGSSGSESDAQKSQRKSQSTTC